MSRPKLPGVIAALVLANAVAHAQPPGASLDGLLAEGAAAFSRNDCDSANRSYGAAAAAARAAAEHGALALALRRLGICAYRVGDNFGALGFYRDGVDAAKTARRDDLLAENTHGAALALRHLGRFVEALELAEQRYALAQRDGSPRAMLPAITLLAQLYGLTGRGRDQVRLLETALSIARASGDRTGERIALNNLTYRLVDFGDIDNALYYVRQMEAGADPNDRAAMAEMYSNRGVLLRRAGRPAEARESYRKALELAAMPRDWRIRTAALFNLALANQALGRHEETAAVLEEALTLGVELKNDEYISRVENGRAIVFRRLGRPAEALQAAERALAIGRSAGSPERVIEALLALGNLRADAGDAGAARSAYRESLELIESVRTQGPGDPEQRRLEAEGVLPAYQTMVRFEARQGDVFEALRWAEHAKARVLTAILASGGLGEQRVMSVAEREEEQALRKAVEAANRRLSEGSTPETRARAAEAGARLDAFRLGLYGRHAELGSGAGEFAAAGRDEVAALLPAGTAAIVYFDLGDAMAAFVIRRGAGGAPALDYVELPLDPAALRAEAGAFRKALAQRDLDYGRAARRLYERLVKPLERHLAGTSALIVSPDGPLWELPFGALIDGRGRHLIETRSIRLAPSLTALAHLRQRATPPRAGRLSFLGMASTAPLGAAPIPEAAREVEAIAALYPSGSPVFIGPHATADVFRRRAPDASVVHIAAHAEINNIAPLFSFLQLDTQTIPARDLMDLPLRARLVVLSACETALGTASGGEGLIGLGWAVTAAGASATIVSQWKVDSGSTAALMVALHRGFARKGQTAAEALRGAVLETRGLPGYRHPFYWAAFTLLGQ